MKRLIPRWRKMTRASTAGATSSKCPEAELRRRSSDMRRLICVFGIATAVAAGTAHAAPGWKVVKSRSVSGQFAVTAISATVSTPKGVAVRLSGQVDSGNAVIACSRNFSVTSNSRSYRRAGFYVLPMMRAASRCHIVASVSGSGRVTVQILRR
jgi:hypothetical protein